MNDTVPRFTPRQATALTGVTARRLAQWHSEGLVVPAYSGEAGWLGHTRLCPVKDVLALRILLVLRNTHRITNKYLVDANAFFRERYEDPWTDLTFHTLNKRVYFDNPSPDEVTESAKIGQLPLPVPLADVIAPVRENILMFTTRQPSDFGEIGHRRGVMGGQAIVAGTRIQTSSIWRWYEASHDTARIRRADPILTDADVAAAIAFEQTRREELPTHHKRPA